MKQTKLLACAAMLSFMAFQAQAQSDGPSDFHTITVSVPAVALLDLETSGTRNFTASYVSTGEAGDKLTVPANNSDLWLNYSSIIPANKLRRVDVKANVVVSGVDINVVAAAATSGGKGALGSPGALVKLTTADQPLITGIGSAYTVTGATNGHQLTYSFTALDGDYAALRAADTPVTVTYTLVEY